MHEMGIAMQVVEIAKASVPPNLTDVAIEKVNLRVGKLSAVVPRSLRFCFEIIAKDDPMFKNATLSIEEVDVKVRCRNCRNEWTVEGPAFTCENCNGGSIDLLSGQELEIISIELEQ